MTRNEFQEYDLANILRIAKEAALKGASIHRNGLSRNIASQTKSSELDLVCEIDANTEKAITEFILQERPNDSIIGEEGTNYTGDSGVTWIIDPLDGTVNYLHRFPAYGISIGVEIDGMGVVGVVFDTSREQIYYGVIDNQAKCDERAICVSTCNSLSKALIATGFLPNPKIRTLQGKILTDILPNVLDIRRSGSPAIDLCRVASGIIDGFYEFGLRIWDISAGKTIAEAAGARVTQIPINNEAANSLIVASSPEIHEQLLDLALKSWEKHQ